MTLSGMKRRGTLGRTAQGGDLMLISPTSGTFGRKFSLGRWEVRGVSIEGSKPVEEHSNLTTGSTNDDAATTLLTAFEFDQEFIDSVLGQKSSHHPMNDDLTTFYSSDRPDTAASDASTEAPIEREQGGSGPFWNRSREDSKAERGRFYHVGSTDLFSEPEPAVLTPRQSIPGLVHPQHEGDADDEPSPFAFGTGGSFSGYDSYDYRHRQPIDALLAASHEFPHFPSYSNEDGAADQWMANSRPRGSDATIRYEEDDSIFKATALSPTKEAALAAIQKEDGDGAERYVYLSRELAADPVLVEQILQLFPFSFSPFLCLDY